MMNSLIDFSMLMKARPMQDYNVFSEIIHA